MAEDQVLEGSKHAGKGFSCQALVSASTSEESIPGFIAFIADSQKFRSRNSLFIAYRFVESEGYEQTEEEAASLKLLHLLQRLGVENIIVGVVLWTDLPIQALGSDLYRAILEAARTLVETIHSEAASLRTTQADLPKRTLIQLPPLSPEKWQRHRQKRRALNLSLDYPHSAEPAQCLGDKDYEANMSELAATAKKVNTALVSSLQKYAESSTVNALLRLLLVILARTTRKCVEPGDLLVGHNLRIALISFRPIYLPPRQVAIVQNLLRKVETSRIPLGLETEISLLSSWAKAAIRLCSQPTLQPLTLREEPQEPALLFSTATSVRQGRYGTPTQFVFDGLRSKNIAKIVQLTRKKEVPKTGLEALTELILQGKTEEEAWGTLPPVVDKTSLGLDSELESKLLEARRKQLEQEERINRLIGLQLEDLKIEPHSLVGIPDADVYKFVENSDLRQLPTGMLMAFARKLKERRRRKSKKLAN
jgi:hypothetical protein